MNGEVIYAPTYGCGIITSSSSSTMFNEGVDSTPIVRTLGHLGIEVECVVILCKGIHGLC